MVATILWQEIQILWVRQPCTVRIIVATRIWFLLQWMIWKIQSRLSFSNIFIQNWIKRVNQGSEFLNNLNYRWKVIAAPLISLKLRRKPRQLKLFIRGSPKLIMSTRPISLIIMQICNPRSILSKSPRTTPVLFRLYSNPMCQVPSNKQLRGSNYIIHSTTKSIIAIRIRLLTPLPRKSLKAFNSSKASSFNNNCISNQHCKLQEVWYLALKFTSIRGNPWGKLMSETIISLQLPAWNISTPSRMSSIKT